MCLGILNITNDVPFFLTACHLPENVTHCPFKEKGNATFLKLPVYMLLHCNLLSKVVGVRYYSSIPSS